MTDNPVEFSLESGSSLFMCGAHEVVFRRKGLPGAIRLMIHLENRTIDELEAELNHLLNKDN